MFPKFAGDGVVADEAWVEAKRGLENRKTNRTHSRRNKIKYIFIF